MLSCNHDCFNCPYPDVPDECLSAPLTYDEYKESIRIDSESRYEQKSNKEKRAAAWQKAYREANKEKIAVQQKANYEANKEKVAAKRKADYEAHREERIAYQKAYREANRYEIAAKRKARREASREKLAAKQNCIRTARKSHSMRQSDLARLVGVNTSTISAWEHGTSPANWDNLCAVLPELEEYRP